MKKHPYLKEKTPEPRGPFQKIEGRTLLDRRKNRGSYGDISNIKAG